MWLLRKKLNRMEFLRKKLKKDRIFAISYVRELLRSGKVKEAKKFARLIEGDNLVYAKLLVELGEVEKAFLILEGVIAENPFLPGVLAVYSELAFKLGFLDKLDKAMSLLRFFGFDKEGVESEGKALKSEGEEVIVLDEGFVEEEIITLDTAKYYFEQCLFEEARDTLVKLLEKEDNEEARELLGKVNFYVSLLEPEEPK
ncbi:MAG: hypothetical protein ABIM21_06530 [candidate division WOR-3 bacterium]